MKKESKEDKTKGERVICLIFASHLNFYPSAIPMGRAVSCWTALAVAPAGRCPIGIRSSRLNEH